MKRKYYLSTLFLLMFLSINAQFQWQAIQSLANSTASLQRYDDVFFLDENIGWAANGFFAAIYKTTDGGLNWTKQVDGNDLGGGGLYFRNVEFLNANIGFIGTFQGKFFKTIDGGSNWSEVTNINPNPSGICGIDAVGTSTIYGVGVFSEPARLIKSIDSGNTWQSIDMSAHATALVEVKFVDENIGYAAGKNATGAIVLKTINGGTTWTEIYNSGIVGEYVWKLQILDGTSNTVIFGAIQQVASSATSKLIKTNDAGTTWTEKSVMGNDIQAVGFISETHGWMGGSDMGILETTDGGTTWNNISVGGNLNRIFVINNTYAFAAGTTIYKYTDQTLSTEDLGFARVPLEVKLSKNPVDDILEFSIQYRGSDNMVIELYDIAGKFIKQLVKDKIVDASGILKEYSFDVKEYSTGVYILNFHNNTGRQSLKFIKG